MVQHTHARIAVIDYGAGNLHSVMGALRRANANAHVVTRPQELDESKGIILPGVGAFGYAADMLARSHFDDALKEKAAAGVPLLGICLGMQLLFSHSEESPGAEGLGILDGEVLRLRADNLKTPHMGWTSITPHGGRLLGGIEDGAFVYFVHSFAVHSRDCICASAQYGEIFDATVERGNIFATQFHPEKSSAVGAKILANFLDVCKEGRV